MIKKRYLLAVFFVSFIVSFILFNVSASAKADNKGPKTKIYIFPKKVSYPKLEIDDLFKTNVKIDDVNNLYAYEFKLKYNPEVLEFVEISSSFLSGFNIERTGETSVIKYAVASKYPAEPKTGDGVLATITFRVKTMGESVLDIYDTKLLDSNINRIDHAVKDGYFSNEDNEIEVELEWEENIANVELSTEVSNLESIIQTNMGFSEMISPQSSGCTDVDSDLYGVDDTSSCTYSEVDCDDFDPMMNPGNGEFCDGKDNDCDGYIDEPDVCLSGDVDHQTSSDYYVVGLEDLLILGQSYGSKKGEPRYDNICVNNGWYCDLNDDGIVNIFDLAKIGKNYENTILAGCVDVTVEFESGTPLPYADVYVVNPYQFFGTTNSTGQATRCCFLDPGNYFVNASYNNEQFGSDTSLSVVGDGSGSTTIIGSCVKATIHVQDEFGQPINEAWLKIFTGAYVFVEEGPTDIYGNYETTCLEDGPYMYELTTPVGCEKDWAFDLPDDTYVLVEPPWDSCPY